jgi:hypothetical protein
LRLSRKRKKVPGLFSENKPGTFFQHLFQSIGNIKITARQVGMCVVTGQPIST